MKTTLELPDELMRAIKVRAAQQDRKIKDVVVELLSRALAQSQGAVAAAPPWRVRLPLVRRGAAVGPEMTPELVAAALLDEEAGGHRDAAL